MDLEKIKSFSFSLMKKETDLGNETAEYTKKITAKFDILKDFILEEQTLKDLIDKIYKDLSQKAPDDVDSLGLWVEYDNITLDNAIPISVLNDIQQYSAPDVNSVFEFFKMTFMD